MSNLTIVEYSGMGVDPRTGGSTQFLSLPPLAQQVMVIGSGNSVSNEFQAGTKVVTLYSEAACRVKVGAAPDASDAGFLLTPNVEKTYVLPTGRAGLRLAVIDGLPQPTPLLTAAPALNSNVAGSAVTWTAGSATGTPAPTLTYSLRKNDVEVATASGSYAATAAGDRLQVVMTATNTGGKITSSSKEVVVSAAAVTVPSVSVAPVLSPVAAGGAITFTPGTFVGTPTYKLMRGVTVLAASIASGDVVPGTVADDQVFVRLVASIPGQASAQADSNTVVVAASSGSPYVNSYMAYGQGYARPPIAGLIAILSASQRYSMLRKYWGKVGSNFQPRRFIAQFSAHVNNGVGAGAWPTQQPLPTDIAVNGFCVYYGPARSSTLAGFTPLIASFSNGTICSSSSGAPIVSDSFLAALAGLPLGTHLYIETAYDVPAAGVAGIVRIPAVYTFDVDVADEGVVRNGVTTNGVLGPYTVGLGGALVGARQQYGWGPTGMYATGHQKGPVTLGWGDSIEWGDGETPKGFADGGVWGSFNRALLASDTHGMLIAVPGSSPAQITHNYPATWMGSIGRSMALVDQITTINGGQCPFTYDYTNHGINSSNGIAGVGVDATTAATGLATSAVDTYCGRSWLGATGGVSNFVLNMRNVAELMQSKLPSIPFSRMIHCGVITKTGTTDGWQTAENQTINPGFIGQVRPFMAALRAGTLQDRYGIFIDTPQAFNPANTELWAAHPAVGASATTLVADITASALSATLTDASLFEIGDLIVWNPDTSNGVGLDKAALISNKVGNVLTFPSATTNVSNITAGSKISGKLTAEGTHGSRRPYAAAGAYAGAVLVTLPT